MADELFVEQDVLRIQAIQNDAITALADTTGINIGAAVTGTDGQIVVIVSGTPTAVNIVGVANRTSVSFSGGQLIIDLFQNLSPASSPSFAGLTLTTTPLALASGGLGATTAAGGRTTLGIDTIATRKSNLTAIVAPTVTDDSAAGYSAGSLWNDTVGLQAYFCISAGVGVALWKQIT